MPRYVKAAVPEIRDYQSALKYLKEGANPTKYRQLWGTSTWVGLTHNGYPQIVHRKIPLITYLPDGSFVLNTSDNLYRLLRRKINDYIPSPYVVERMYKSTHWQVKNMETYTKTPFVDGLTVNPNGEPEFDNTLAEATLASNEQWSIWADKYVADYVEWLKSGKVGDSYLDIEFNDGRPTKQQIQDIIHFEKYPISLLMSALDFDNPDPFFRRVADHISVLPKSHWKYDELTLNRCWGCYKRVLRRLVRKSLGLAL